MIGCESVNSDAPTDPIAKKAEEIHNSIFTIDTHTDIPKAFLRGYDPGERHNIDNGQVDFPRMKDGGIDAMFFVNFVRQKGRDPESIGKAKIKAFRNFAHIHKSVADNPDLAEIAYTVEDGYRIAKSGKRAIYIGMENGYPLGKDINLVKTYYDLGARYITLCHTTNNDICDSSNDRRGPEHNGLSDFGKEVVKEMNRLGIIVDVSHISEKSFYDVIESTTAPVVATHSGAKALRKHPRNMTDAQLKKLAENGGVIQMVILGFYVKETTQSPEGAAAYKEWRARLSNAVSEKERNALIEEEGKLRVKFAKDQPSISDAVDHIDHIVKLIGIDHVGIGR